MSAASSLVALCWAELLWTPLQRSYRHPCRRCCASNRGCVLCRRNIASSRFFDPTVQAFTALARGDFNICRRRSQGVKAREIRTTSYSRAAKLVRAVTRSRGPAWSDGANRIFLGSCRPGWIANLSPGPIRCEQLHRPTANLGTAPPSRGD